mgnify:CR=1 FL=1
MRNPQILKEVVDKKPMGHNDKAEAIQRRLSNFSGNKAKFHDKKSDARKDRG